MQKALRIFVLVLLGVFIDRVFLPHSGPRTIPVGALSESSDDTIRSGAALPIRPGKTDSTLARTAAEAARSGSDTAAARHARKPSPEFHVEQPRNEKPVLSPELEAKLLELAKSPIPRAIKPGETVNADGSVDVYGDAEDGRRFYRHFDPRGELTKEGWNDEPGNEDVHRTYYETGQLKTVHWNRRDGSKTSIGFTLGGLYEYRWDKLSDGTEISTDYDDAGQVKGVYRKGPDGKMVHEAG